MTRQEAIHLAQNRVGRKMILVVYRPDPKTRPFAYAVVEYELFMTHGGSYDEETRYVLPHLEVCKIS